MSPIEAELDSEPEPDMAAIEIELDAALLDHDVAVDVDEVSHTDAHRRNAAALAVLADEALARAQCCIGR